MECGEGEGRKEMKEEKRRVFWRDRRKKYVSNLMSIQGERQKKKRWCARRESNSRQHGHNVLCYHYTTNAYLLGRCPQVWFYISLLAFSPLFSSTHHITKITPHTSHHATPQDPSSFWAINKGHQPIRRGPLRNCSPLMLDAFSGRASHIGILITSCSTVVDNLVFSYFLLSFT